MSGLERARATLAAFGKRHGLERFVLDEEGALTLNLDEDLYVFQYNEVLDTLVLMAAIGTVPPKARAMVFGQLLAANLFWGECGGCTFAFEPSEELVMMQYSMDAGKLDEQSFARAFDELRAVAREWNGRLREWVGAELDGPAPERFASSW